MRYGYDPSKGTYGPYGRWVEYPDEIGEWVLDEDLESLDRRSMYIYLLAALGLSTGLLVAALGLWAELRFADDPFSKGGSDLSFIIGVGLFLSFFLPLQTLYDCNKERMAFFTTGIVLLYLQSGNRWEMDHIPWNWIKGYSKEDHWYLGPILRVDYYGQVLLIPETMEEYDQVEELVTGRVPCVETGWLANL